MKLIKISGIDVKNVIATTHVNKKGEMFYNIILGSKDSTQKFYTLYIGTKFKRPTSSEDKYELIGDDFCISSIKTKKGDNLKDLNGNQIYCIYRDENTMYKSDVLLLLEIPNKMYTDVSYKLEGDIEELAKASVGKERMGVVYSSPALMLEIFGDCKITWQGLDRNKNQVGKQILYSYDKGTWDITNLDNN